MLLQEGEEILSAQLIWLIFLAGDTGWATRVTFRFLTSSFCLPTPRCRRHGCHRSAEPGATGGQQQIGRAHGERRGQPAAQHRPGAGDRRLHGHPSLRPPHRSAGGWNAPLRRGGPAHCRVSQPHTHSLTSYTPHSKITVIKTLLKVHFNSVNVKITP